MSDSRSLSFSTVRIPPPSSYSPLRSPKRRQHLQNLQVDEDPLLGTLSPEAILDALAAINTVTAHGSYSKNLLTRSISQASPEDRLLGARAALAAQKLREWLKELQAWQWPTGIGIQQGKGFISPIDNRSEYWGSLPAHQVAEYEARVEQIRDAMDDLNVEELKEHIMNVHVPGRSRPSSAHSAMSTISAPPFTRVQLSDFSAVITATILRALPTLARLNLLLDTWTVRLLVLRQIPGLLAALDSARKCLDSVLHATRESQRNKRYSLLQSTSRREELVQLIGTAGSYMDKVLDSLEGREDSIPETWIDRMDALETDFASWIQLTGTMAIEKVWVLSESEVATQPAVQEDESQRDGVDQSFNGSVTEGEMQIHTDLASSAPSEILDNGPGIDNTTLTNFTSSPEESPSPPTDNTEITEITDSTQSLIAGTTRQSMTNKVAILDTSAAGDDSTVLVNTASKSENTAIDQTIPSAGESSQETETWPSLPSSSEEFGQSHEQEAMEADAVTTPKVEEKLPLRMNRSLPILDVIQESVSEDSDPNSVQVLADSLNLLPPPVLNDEENVSSPESKHGAILTAKCEDTPASVSSAVANHNQQSQTDPRGEISSAELHGHDNRPVEISNATANQDNELAVPNQILGETLPITESAPMNELSAGNVDLPNTLKGDNSEKAREGSLETSKSDAFVTELDANESSAHHLDSANPQALMTPSLASEVAINETRDSPLEESPIKVMATDSQNFGPFLERNMPLHPDVPVQSIESSIEQDVPTRPLRSHGIAQPHSRKTSGQSHRSTVPFSPGVFSSTSDRTIRERSSPQLSSSALQDLEGYKQSNDASLTLQRFINDKYDGRYSVNQEMHSDSSSSREDNLPFSREDTDSPRFRDRSESPPPNAVPRRAIRGPSSSLMRGTISSLNKAVGIGKRVESDPHSNESAEKVRSLSRLGSPYDVDSDPTPWRRKSSTSDLLHAPKHYLQHQPSVESIGSFVSSNSMSDARRRYSFSTDGGSFAIRPVHEADSDLQKKIHSILTGIPGKIRLSNNVARDHDQQSVVSSMSSTRRPRLTARSPFSTPSRAGTPTPSEGFTSSARQRRSASHKSEDKTVKVYHLHHRGKTEPTKLFVRTVGEDGERVMVRVGGGWADLGEYLREYVMHHGRQTPSTSHVEVKGLPATSTSPGSTTSAAATVVNQNSPKGPATLLAGKRSASSLSVHKTRRVSKQSELPEVAIDDVETTTDNLPLPSHPSIGRRPSISSLNSVSVSSVLGDGSSVYSPHPGSARTPLSHSGTPLGLAGPKPRTRHVSMTPESEAWVEDVIGQARRTSSITVKPPTQKHTDHRSDRESLNSSRMGTRSVSDFPSVGRNKRVVLKGLGTHDRL